jgi:hypothetical protein
MRVGDLLFWMGLRTSVGLPEFRGRLKADSSMSVLSVYALSVL